MVTVSNVQLAIGWPLFLEDIMNYMNRRKGHFVGNCIHSKANAGKVNRRTAGKDYRSGKARSIKIKEVR